MKSCSIPSSDVKGNEEKRYKILTTPPLREGEVNVSYPENQAKYIFVDMFPEPLQAEM